jgi:4-amino-4-deoxy-L-arabinose transferase-like glycosyltransferase
VTTTYTQTVALRRGAASIALPTQLLLLLLGHIVIWTWVGVAARTNFDTPGDMVEAYVWAQGWQWGYFKHPPLSAWVTGLWFSVVPESHFGFSLLTAVNGAIGLAGVAALAGEFLPRRGVLAAVALAALTPGMTGLAMRFNANSILLSSWPWVLAFFVRLMQRGRAADAVGCGLACAAVVLGKYYSGVLLLTLMVAAVTVPAWRLRLRQSVTWLAPAVFAVCVAPHVLWLLAQTQGPLQYAQAATGQGGEWSALGRCLSFGTAQWLALLPSLLLLAWALRAGTRFRAWKQALLASWQWRGQPLWILAMLPTVLTIVVTALTHARTAWLWGLPIGSVLAVLVTVRALDAGGSIDVRRLWRGLLVTWLTVAVAAPLWWRYDAGRQPERVGEPREELALAVDRAWREFGGDEPLPFIAGTRSLAASIAFYAPSHPRYWSLWNPATETPWIDVSRMQDAGGIIVCAAADDDCIGHAEFWSADRHDIRLAKAVRGRHFAERQFVYYVVPPEAAANAR